MFEPVTKDRLYQRIVDQITRAILTGKMNAGDQVPTETELAEQFAVSRTVVREAINTLKSRGLVEVTPGKGTFITQPPIDTVIDSLNVILELEDHSFDDLTVARRLLEIPIARLAALNANPNNLSALEDYLQKMEAATDDAEEFIHWDTAFHSELARATQNMVLAILVQPIVTMMESTREAVAHVPEMVERALGFHHKIFEAVRDGDEAAAENIMHDHLDQVSNDIAEARKRGL
jgi:GntR family transcriptional repressor for pyruvate dehydrogenase complex